MYNLEQVYNENKVYIYNLCFRYLKNKELAQDIASDTFLKFQENGNFEGKSNIKSYIGRIAINLCIDELKNPNAIDRLIDIEFVEYSDNYDVFLGILNNLNPPELRILKLKYIDGIEFKDLAKMYGLGVSAMKMRVKRIKDNMNKIYESLL